MSRLAHPPCDDDDLDKRMATKCEKCVIGFEEGYQDEISTLILEGDYIDLNDKSQIFTTVFKFCPTCGRGLDNGKKIKSSG